jgi:argonaute-like protein implicated in RNA metabolism and viral defense
MTASILSADFLLVDPSKIKTLYAYHLDVGESSLQAIGRKLAYEIDRFFDTPNEYWAWSSPVLISNTQKAPEQLHLLLRLLWQNQPEPFRDLRSIQSITPDRFTPQHQADYAHAIVRKRLGQKIRHILKAEDQEQDNIRIERRYETRAWEIQGYPALSITVRSNVILTAGFSAIAAKLDDPESLIGTWALVTAQDFKGKIIEIIGSLAEHRDRLFNSSRNDHVKAQIQAAADHEIVVKIQTASKRSYDYPLCCLQPSLDMDTLSKFELDTYKITKAWRFSPQVRRQLVQKIADQISAETLINSSDYPHCFTTAESLQLSNQIQVGNHQAFPYVEKQLMKQLRQHGIYQKAAKFMQNGGEFVIGVIDARRDRRPTRFKQKLVDLLTSMGFKPRFLPPHVVTQISPVTLETAVQTVKAQNPDIILGLLPQKRPGDGSVYGRLKALTVGDDLPSQMVYEPTLGKSYAENNVVLGMLAKTGNTLFTLAEPLAFADYVVGLDVARAVKANLSGSINSTAIARVYLNTGDLFGYRINDAPIPGETLPLNVLESLFPAEHFAGKRVIIHRDGLFRGAEKHHLQTIALHLGATFYYVEVRKSGAPRLYRELPPADPAQPSAIAPPQKGDCLIFSNTAALLVSSLPPSSGVTPQPLHIHCDPQLGIQNAIHSILALTLLHHGSVKSPRLPVSLHYSDKIGSLTLKGIKPKHLDGVLPFWL